jgi:hypothetical protein
MAIRCPNCSREFDVTLFEFDRTVKCICGNIITLQHKEIIKETFIARLEEEKKIVEIKNLADKISFLIVSTDYPKIDIEIEKIKFREKIQELFPDKIHLFELIYEPRFRRLEEQFRGS